MRADGGEDMKASVTETTLKNTHDLTVCIDLLTHIVVALATPDDDRPSSRFRCSRDSGARCTTYRSGASPGCLMTSTRNTSGTSTAPRRREAPLGPRTR